MSKWQDIETLPRDGTPIQRWHKVHNCPVSVRFLSKEEKGLFGAHVLDWIEITKTTTWPEASFTPHWMPLPDPPEDTTP